MKFNENEHAKDLSELDESFAYLWLDDSIKGKVSSSQSSKVRVPTQHLDDLQEEAKEPTKYIMGRNHPES